MTAVTKVEARAALARKLDELGDSLRLVAVDLVEQADNIGVALADVTDYVAVITERAASLARAAEQLAQAVATLTGKGGAT